MSAKNMVQRAYLVEGATVRRTLSDSRGLVFHPERKNWEPPMGARVVPVRGTYERWSDVPSVWLGFSPYFR